ncbi:IucA/IucC family C-terminal-domain containing protein [Alteribacillus iranensis]|uniref:Ferric iron reductase protein FhuF, involved in iron transport n=1 Tax=Alteribacillus iranensis TaxID=930128 RepID=A0A1I2DP63_9BACI|nr:IucA/IucC family C-terminal-domain containing protein [Alteribacillus iranensis]SFE82248.1 Ferric iron reductase protein FhuF, involved in iron transport [Alteribacillus iranensis]
MKNSLMLKHSSTISSIDWTDASLCEEYLYYMKRLIQAPSLDVTASQFAKSYAKVVVLPALSKMTLEDKAYDMSIHNCQLTLGKNEAKWNPSLQLVNAQEDFHKKGPREIWREQAIATLFREHVNRIWYTLFDVTAVSRALLWENTAVRIFSLYEKKLMKHATPEVKARIEEDFQYLIHDAKSEVFGTKTNPLQLFYSTKQSEDSVRVRQTCCYYYQTGTSKGKFCGACPKKECNSK